MRSESNSTRQNHAETQRSWRPLSILLHPNLQWHTLGHSRDRRQWGRMWNVLPPKPFLHGLRWLFLAAALPCQHVTHRHPGEEQCFTPLIVTCRKNHKAIVQEGAVYYTRCSKSLSHKSLLVCCSLFLHCKITDMLSFSRNLAPGKRLMLLAHLDVCQVLL